MNIGLLGFTLENANKGCEALTYSFLYIIQNIYKEKINIRYYSTVELFGDIKSFFPEIDFSFYLLSRKNTIINLRKDMQDNCDIIFDISFGDGFSDIYNPRREFWNALAKQQAVHSKVPFILLPQTYGPFNNKFLEWQAKSAIRGAKMVFSRDEISTKYIEGLASIKVITVTDLAFSLPYKALELPDNGKIKLGLNVSGLLWKGGFYRENQFGLKVDYQKYITMIIEHYLKSPDYEIHLIPHVIESVSASNDGDLYVNDCLLKNYNSLIKAPAFRNPIETKNYIASMDVITAARMHATVDAFSALVPVIPFAYSRKFEGLYGSIGYRYIIDGCIDDTENAVNRTIQWIDSRKKLQIAEQTCIKMIEEKNQAFYKKIESIIKS